MIAYIASDSTTQLETFYQILTFCNWTTRWVDVEALDISKPFEPVWVALLSNIYLLPISRTLYFDKELLPNDYSIQVMVNSLSSHSVIADYNILHSSCSSKLIAAVETELFRISLVISPSTEFVVISKWVDENLVYFNTGQNQFSYYYKQDKWDLNITCLIEFWPGSHWQ